MRRLQYLLFLPLAAATLAAQPSTPQAGTVQASPPSSATSTSTPAAPRSPARETYAPPVFNATTRNVVLDVVVSDSKGHPVPGLTRDDFVIREDDTPQQTRSFEAVTAGAGAASAPHTILLVDEMNTRFQDMAYTRYSVDRLLKHGEAAYGGGTRGPALLDQPTALYVLSNDGLHVLEDYTRDSAAIDSALRRHKAVLPWRLHGGFYRAAERIDISLTALQQIAMANIGNPGHKNIVWISPGFPIFSALEIGADGQKRLYDAIRHLSDQMLKARVSIYSVDPRGVEGLVNNRGFASNDVAFSTYIDAASSAGQVAFGDLAIQTLAVQTGGHAFYGRNDVDREIASSITDGNTYYTLSYAPSNHNFNGEFRKIKISVIDRPGLKVQTRDGYYAFPDGQALPEKEQLRELASSLYGPLQYTAIPIPITISKLQGSPPVVSVRFIVPTSSLSWRPDAKGGMQSTVTVVAADQDKHGHWRESTAHAYSVLLANGIDPSPQRGASLSFEMPYRDSSQLRFIVRDDASGRIGSAELTVSPTKHS